MNTDLDAIAIQNLKLIGNLGDTIEDYNLVIDGKNITQSNDNYEGIFNLKELEYPIYFSFHQVFNSIRYSNLYKIEGYQTRELIHLIDECIDKIVDILDKTTNDSYNQMISQLMDDIDNKYLVLKERDSSCSFWKISETFNDYLDTFADALRECDKYLYITTRYDGLFEDSEESEGSNGSGSDADDEKEELNEETCEINPNLVYDIKKDN